MPSPHRKGDKKMTERVKNNLSIEQKALEQIDRTECKPADEKFMELRGMILRRAVKPRRIRKESRD